MRLPVFIVILLMALSVQAGSASTRFKVAPSSSPTIEARWVKKTLSVNIDKTSIPADFEVDPRALAKILSKAIGVWNSFDGDAPKFFISNQTASEKSLSDVVIRFARSADDLQLFSRDDSDAAAFTRLYATPDGRITRSVIVLNPNAIFDSSQLAGAFSMEAVIAHELGHALGLTHSIGLSSMMFPQSALSGAQKKITPSLSEDDRNNLRSLYGDESCCFEIHGRVSNSDGEELSGFNVVIESLTDSRLLAVRRVAENGTYSVKGLTNREIGIRVLNEDHVIVGSLDVILSSEKGSRARIFELDEIPARLHRVARRTFFGNDEILSIGALDSDGVEGMEFSLGIEISGGDRHVVSAHFGGLFSGLIPELVLDSQEWTIWRLIADADSEAVEGEYSFYIQGEGYSLMIPGLLRIRKDAGESSEKY